MYNLFKRIFDKAYTKADQLIVLGRDMADVLGRKVGKGKILRLQLLKIGLTLTISNHSRFLRVR